MSEKLNGRKYKEVWDFQIVGGIKFGEKSDSDPHRYQYDINLPIASN